FTFTWVNPPWTALKRTKVERRPLLIFLIEPSQLLRRGPQTIAQGHPPHSEIGPHNSKLGKTSGRGADSRISQRQPAHSPQPLAQFEFFHQRHIRNAADRAQYVSSDKHGLVTQNAPPQQEPDTAT